VLIERIIRQLLPIMNSSWANVVNAEFTLEHIETNAQFAQLISPNEPIAIVTLDAHIGEVEGMMNICIPYLVIEPIISRLSSKHWFSTKLAEEDERKYYQLLAAQIEATPVEVRAVLGQASITIRELIELQKGDVIKLDKKVDEDIAIYVGDVKKFCGIVGLKKHNLAVQITSICEEGGKI